jgi:hypothetical protein
MQAKSRSPNEIGPLRVISTVFGEVRRRVRSPPTPEGLRALQRIDVLGQCTKSLRSSPLRGSVRRGVGNKPIG